VQANDLKTLYHENKVTNYNYIQLDTTLSEFYNLQGMCERIKSTVFPKEFNLLAKIFVLSFTSLVPFHLIDSIGFYVIPITVFEGFVFYALSELPNFYENPFDNHHQDTSVNAISRVIERDLLQMIGEKDIPPKIQPIEGVLH